MNAPAVVLTDPADPRELLRLAHRCARQVSFLWTPADDRLRFGDEVSEFLSPGLLENVRTGADLLARVDPHDRARLNEALVRALKSAAQHDGAGGIGGTIHAALIRVRSTGRQWHWIAMRGHVTATDAQGRGTRVSGVLVDETERETERREALQMRDLYAMLSAINRAIGGADDRHLLLTQLCEVAVVHGHCALAFVSLFDKASGRMHAYAEASDAVLALNSPDAPERDGALRSEKLTKSVMHAGVPHTYNDLGALTDPHQSHQPHAWLAPALEAGFRSVGCFPLHEQGEAIGGLLLYSREAQHFHRGMTALLQGMGADVSNALGHLLIKRQQADTNRRLHEANRQFQTAMKASLDGMLVVAGDGAIIETNAAARDLLGCETEHSQPLTMTGTAPRNLFVSFTPARLRAARKSQVRRLLSPGAAAGDARRRIETVLSRNDGHELPVELVLTPLQVGEDGLLMVTVRDLTVAHDQRNQLVSAARRFEQLFEQSPDGILVHVDGRIVLVNGRLRAMLGVGAAEQLVGGSISRWVDADDLHRLTAHAVSADWSEFSRRVDAADRHRAEDRMRLLTAGERPSATAEVRLRRADGGVMDVETLASDTEFEGQTARQVVLRDIGERKRLERRQTSQQGVLGLIAARRPLAEVLSAVARAVDLNAPGVRCTVFVTAADGESFVALHTAAESRADLLQTEELRRIAADSPSAIGRAASLREPVFIEDVSAERVPGDVSGRVPGRVPGRVQAVRRLLGAQAVGAWPLLSRSGELMGVIYLALPHTGAPSPLVLQLVADYSDLTAVAIDNDRQAARIRHLAQHDVLTSLPNRATFKELLDHAIDRARRRGTQLAAMFIDLDRFKLINDTFGHGTGDAVLCKAAERLKETIRSCDRVARMGGDEFIVLVDELASPDAAAEIAQRVLRALAKPVSLGGQEHELSASIGIAVHPRDGGDSEALIKHADIAMYRAKQSGRNGYSFFAEADNAHATERFALQAQLKRALQRREFVLHYQPRVDLRTGRIRGVEALVRWQHPERGLVMPGGFITVVEESGLILALGRQVMEMAFADVPRLREHGGDVTVAINLSAMQIGADGFADEVRELVARTGVQPSAIEFEITESLLMRDPEQARRVIETLQQTGFSFSLDDFGTGYSSLTYLKRFPVQCVKIDRSFVKDIPGDASDLAITRAIVAMAHSLQLCVVAEGVETPEQLEALRQMDCDQYQGYYFSKPVAIEHVLGLMEVAVAE